jgi:hypothetical protein
VEGQLDLVSDNRSAAVATVFTTEDSVVASPSAPSIRAPTSGLSRSSGESRVPVLTQSGARSRVGLRDGVGKPSGRARCGRQPAESCSSGRGSLFSCAAWPIWVTTRCEPRTKPRLPGRAASKTCREDQVVCRVCEATHRGSIDRSITVGLIETGRGSPRALVPLLAGWHIA